jgi:hypothetical protein
LLPSLQAFLENGGQARFTVGIDIENTSYEGLDDLLILGDIGDSQVHVYHNEYSVTFHPKVYLLENENVARLIVGSNNLTESGLYTNTEVGLQLDLPVDHPVIVDIHRAIDSWRDTSEDLSKLLNEDLFEDLLAEGYIEKEETIRRRIAQQRATRNTGGTQRRKLFGTKRIARPVIPPTPNEAPAPPVAAPQAPAPRSRIIGSLSRGRRMPPINITEILLFRVRPARGTQVQIPIPLRNSAYFARHNEIIGPDGTSRGISVTRPERGGGKVNTVKVEIPESHGMTMPIIRLEHTSGGIRYTVYDGAMRDGKEFADALEEGRHTVPVETVLTKPSTPNESQWYRFV